MDETPKLDKEGIRHVQSCVRSFLFYDRAVDPTMLVALNEIGTQQAHATQLTLKKCSMLMDYEATHPLEIIRYHTSDMILHVD